MERISRRKGWLLFILLSSGIAVLLGKNWLFASAVCPRLQDLLLYGSAIVIGLIGLVYVLITRNDAIVNQIISILVVMGSILLFSGVAGAVLGKRADTQMVFCPRTCQKSADAEALLKQSKLDGAEEVARECMESKSTGILPQECEGACDVVLSRILFKKVDATVKTLTGAWNEAWIPICDKATAQLTEALSLAGTNNEVTLADAIGQLQARLTEKCTRPTPTSTPAPLVKIQILSKQLSGDEALLNVRVLEDNVFKAGLQPSDFSLKANNAPVAFKLEERGASPSVCMVVAVDNSGSIGANLKDMRVAIDKLNDFRKPGDKFGLITFGSKDNVYLWQSPAPEPLDSSHVDGSGHLTALWDGVNLGLETLQSCQADSPYLLILTDGEDNDSRYMSGSHPADIVDSLVKKASEEDIDICMLDATQDPKRDPDQTAAMKAVARGCGYFSVVDLNSIANQYRNIFGYVTDLYRITIPLGELSAEQIISINVPDAAEVSVDFSTP